MANTEIGKLALYKYRGWEGWAGTKINPLGKAGILYMPLISHADITPDRREILRVLIPSEGTVVTYQRRILRGDLPQSKNGMFDVVYVTPEDKVAVDIETRLEPTDERSQVADLKKVRLGSKKTDQYITVAPRFGEGRRKPLLP